MDARRLLNRFAGRAAYALVLRGLWAVISFAGAALLAQWFTAGDYGRYASVISLITFLSVVCALGLPNALIRLLAQFGGARPTDENAALAHGALRAGHGAALVASGAVALLLSAGAVALHLTGTAGEWLIYVAGAALLPAFTLTEVQAAAARSYGGVFTALGPRDVVWRLLLIPLAWGVTAALPQHQQLVIFLLLAAAGLTLLAAVQAWGLRRAAPKAIWDAAPVYPIAQMMKVSASTWVTQVASVGFRTLDVVIAGLFLPPREVGLYFAASRIAALISFVLTSTNLIVGPEVANLHEAGQRAELTRTLKLASLIVFLPSLMAFIVCVAFPGQALSLFGAGFEEARVELIVLAAGQLVNSAAGCVGVVVMMTGFERKNAEVLVTTSIGTVVAMAVLTPLFGSVGTAVASSAGIVVWNVRLWLFARRHTGYDPSLLGLLRRDSPQP